MGFIEWLTFIVQLLVLVYAYIVINRVEKENPVESIVPRTDEDVRLMM